MRSRPGRTKKDPLKGDNRKEAERNREAARVWISGLEAVQRKLGLQRVIDLSATPFFLRGSGYAEGTLFPWTASDFSLMDAIECGIVKLPRVPVADNIPGGEMPKFRNLWEHIRPKMPKRGRGKAGGLDPLSLPVELQTALQALYGHYEQTFELWERAGIAAPPCFIIVCNNTSTSKLVYDFVSGFFRENEVARPRRGAEAAPVRPTQADHPAVARRPPRLQGRDLPGPAHVPGAGGHGVRTDHGRDRLQSAGRASDQGDAGPLQPRRLDASRALHHLEEAPLGDRPGRCHVNWVVCDSDWEAQFCLVVESHPRVRAYVKNHALGLEVPYRYGSRTRRYLPDFVVLVDDGRGDDDLLRLVVEVKGYRGEDAKDKKTTMDTCWVPGVNNLGAYGRWAFAELTDVYTMEEDFEGALKAQFQALVERAVS